MSSFREPLSAQAIRAALSHVPLLREVAYLPSAGSTNDAARDLAEKGAPHATLVVTDEQTAGRGRMGRSWYMPPRSALAMSILVRPDLDARRANRLTMLAGLAAAEGIEQAAGLSVKLKWPNDVVAMNNDQWTTTDDPLAMITGQWSDVKKMGGILCESAIVGDRIAYAVVGIGLNVNVDFADRPELAAAATSVMLQLGREVDRLSVLAAVVGRFAARFDSLQDGDALREAWAARLVTLGRRVEVRSGEEVSIGLAEGVDDDGALLLRTGDGMLRRLLAAEVTRHL
jgi:BirA family biotin operon repressor/biotin-[acetyl-CoA-carboxylase] ligase